MGKQALQVSKTSVHKAFRSFPPRSAGGPDGIRPQHLLELIQVQEMWNHLLTFFTVFINSVLNGRCHKEFVQILFAFLQWTKNTQYSANCDVGATYSKMRHCTCHRKLG